MKQQIYLSLCILAIGILTACGKNSQPPKQVVTPTPSSIATPSPSPVAILPTPSPSPIPSVPIATPTPKVATSIPSIVPIPKSIYPDPSPVPITVPSPVVQPSPKPKPQASAQPKANSKTEPISKLRIPTDPAQQITPVGIGMAKIGMSFKELKQQMGSGFDYSIKTSFIEGFDAIAVTKAGKIQYYIPYPAGTQFTDTDRIQHLMTDNPNYRTEQGVGPGTSIGQAATVYGSATLSLSKENESREFINFTQHPSGLAFRPKPVGARPFAGEYPESNEDYLKTQKYDNRAAIGQITVSCPEDKCDPDH